uniref:Uncharacterized protein n=1 Tax=Chelonoidis abingdonii TaxID=106734 RepID=A0A8C0IU32_CHEAB
SAMGLGCRYFVGLALLWSVGTALGQGDFCRVSFSVLQYGYKYDCGDYGMQLLAFPSQGHAVCFKVVDEFGTPFEVTNCSICLHWITSGAQGVTIFSAGYNGCHVQKKDGRNYLQVQVEELLSTGAIAATHDVNMTCPRRAKCDHFRGSPALLNPHPVVLGAYLTQEQCRVVAGKIPCRDASNQAACSQAGCCYDETDPTTPCYYGNTVTVQCLVDGHFVLVVSSDMFDHPIILDSVWLAYAQTEYEPIRMTEAFVIFCFPVMQCGTTVQSALLRTGPDGSITRDSTFMDPIYVEVRILQRTNPNLVLSLHHCWATPSANPLEQPQWPILVDGGVRCPFLGDNYRTQLVPIGSELPFPIHHQRFVLSTFAFVDSASQIALDGEVYLFCSASACCPSWLELCRTMCLSGAAISKSLASTVYPAPLLQTNI